MKSALTGVRPAVAVAPGALPVVGHAVSLIRDPLGFLTDVGSQAELVEVRLGPQPAVLVCDPDLTRQVLVNARTFDKGGRLFDKIRHTAGDGLVSSLWPIHRRHRPLVQPAFHPRQLPRYAEVMHEEAAACTRSWRSGDQIDLTTVMQHYTLRVLLRTLFSATTAAPFLDNIQRSVPIVLRGAYQRAMNPVDLLERIPLPVNRRFNAALNSTRRIAATIISQYQHSGTDHGDLLSMLLAARDEKTGEGMTAEEINDHVFTLLIAGTETTASLVAWTFYLLGRHPHVARRLHDELDKLPTDRPVDLVGIRALDHTRRILLETLRLYPATWLLTRMTTTDHELGGYRLPADTTIIYSPYLIHRRPNIFPDPNLFDPDRWLPERAAAIPRSAFIPFGGGSRKCIGEDFGIVEATIALVTIARGWTLEAIDDRPVRPLPRIALSPGALPMTVRAR
ncbi:cytochrome P450 [Streptomyces sp. NPDC057271]|uniref:cytochrome P450 n=1 Tax=unclassified Streptomyces TaxID=2593676 RepID=UPI00362620F3